MKGIEAKYTAKTISTMIRRNRNLDKKFHRKAESNGFYTYDGEIALGVANFAAKESRILSNKFRAFMIHNAFKKNRPFTSAEVAYFDLGENALEAIKQNLVTYSQYMERRSRQQKAINIVRFEILNSDERPAFDAWLESQRNNNDSWFEQKFMTTE